MVGSERTANFLAILAVLAGFAVRAVWAFHVPFNDAPDESCHFPMAKFLRENGRPPTMADVPDPIPVSYPALSPVGYLPCSLTLAWVDLNHPWGFLWARVGNVLVGTATIWMGYRATRLWRPTFSSAVAVAWLLALHPQLAFINAYINNDTLMIFFATLSWRLALGLTSEKANLGQAVAIGVSLGLAYLCKTNGITALASITFVIGWLAWAEKDPKRRLAQLAGLGIAAGVTIAPWIAWSQSQHHSWTGVEIHQRWWEQHLRNAGIEQGYLTREKLDDFLTATVETYWGVFGYCSTKMNSLTYMLLTIGVGVALAGWLAGPTSREPTQQATLLGMLLAVVLVWAAHTYHSYAFGMTAQGRYLMPALWPISALFVEGVLRLARGPRSQGLLGVAVVGLFAFAQMDAWRVEKRSNRIRQEDRRARITMLAFVSPLPGAGELPQNPDVCFDPDTLTQTFAKGVWKIQATKTATIKWSLLNRLPARLAFDATWSAGPQADYGVALASHGKEIEDSRIPFRIAGAGAYRYDFDLAKSKTGQALAPSEPPTEIWLTLPAGATLEIRRLVY